MAPTSMVNTVQKQNVSLEDRVFKLKLEWMMAKDDNERRRISEEIRQLIQSTSSKYPPSLPFRHLVGGVTTDQRIAVKLSTALAFGPTGIIWAFLPIQLRSLGAS